MKIIRHFFTLRKSFNTNFTLLWFFVGSISITQGQALLTDFGAANAYQINYPANLNGVVPAGMEFTFRASNANTGASTLQVNGTTARNIVKNFNVPLEANDIKAGHFVRVIFDATNTSWQMLSSSANPLPSGSISGGGTNTGIAFFNSNNTITTDGGNFTYSKVGSFTGLTLGKIIVKSKSSDGDNLAIGPNAGNTTMSGTFNLMMGLNSGAALTLGSDNTFYGAGTATSNTTGARNVFVGGGAGSSNIGGNDNVILGYDAGSTNTSGSSLVIIGRGANVAANNLSNAIAIGDYANVGGNNMMALGGIGSNAVSVGIGTGIPAQRLHVVGGVRISNLSTPGLVFANANGDLFVSSVAGDNILIGSGSGSSIVLGSKNILIGENAGSFITNTNWNIAIGSDANIATGMLNNIAIGRGALASGGNNSVAIGSGATVVGANMMALGGTAANAVNVGIGTGSPAQRLHVVGGARITNLSASGAVFASANGDLFISTTSGASLWTLNGTNIQNTNPTYSIQLASIAGAYMIGTNSALKMNNNNSVFIGNTSSNTTAQGSNFVGFEAGKSNTTGTNNNFLGYQAGKANTTGNDNHFIGFNAGFSNTTGGLNNFIGGYAGYLNVGGNNNNFIGYAAGTNNVSGSGNNYIGRDAGSNNTSGFNNNFLGFYAGRVNTTGSDNNFMGSQAGENNASGTNNNYIGTKAGYNSTASGNNFIGNLAGQNNLTGSENIFIGTNSGASIVGTNFNIAIGNNANVATGMANGIAIGKNASVSGSNMMALGGNGANAVSVGIGTSTPLNTLHVVGGARIENLSISGAVFANTSGDLFINTSSGISGSGTATGVAFFINNNTITADGGNFNFIKGNYTSLNLGKITIRSTSASGDNLAVGANAGNSTMTGTNNSFFGIQSGQSNSTGFDNSFYGANSGLNNSTGNQNIFFGSSAGQSNVSGNQNTFIGSGAANTQTTGSNNIALGYNAQMGAINLTNAIAIGSGAVVNGSNSAVIGAGITGLGINTGSPTAMIDVNGGARIRNLSATGAVFANANGVLFVSTSSGANAWTINGTNIFPQTLSHNVGIGTPSPTSQLHIIREANNATFDLQTNNDPAISGSDLFLSRARNTIAAPGLLQNGDRIGGLIFRGYDGSGYFTGAAIEAQTAELWASGGKRGTSIVFNTVNLSSITPTEKMRITANGNVGIGTTAPGALLHISTPGFNGYATSIENASLTAGFNGLLVNIGNASNSSTIAGFVSGGIPRFVVRADGNVGIGTNTPLGNLHISAPTGPVIKIQSAGNVTAANTVLAGIDFYDNNGAPTPQANILVKRDVAGGAGDFPTSFEFAVTKDGTTTLTTAMKIGNAGNIFINTTSGAANALLVVGNGHLQSTQTTAPTTTTLTGAGTSGGTCTLTNGTDIAGQITVVMGTTPAAGPIGVCRINFNKPFNTAPIIILTPANATSAININARAIFTTSSLNDFTINIGTGSAIATNTYVWNYIVIETQ